MYIKSITIEDFLPFQGRQQVVFSMDPERNVTLIMGDNGAGKTSLAQAFEWCLYGRAPKDTQQVINAYVRDRIRPGASHRVTVEIAMIKDGVPYTVCRNQQYTRSANGKSVRGERQEFSIFTKQDGQTYHIQDSDLRATINRLLSNELSHYFFFDGEHVKSMRDEIEHGKSTDFAEAVKTILGLRPISSAIDHLKQPGARMSVERRLKLQLDTTGDTALQSKRQEIKKNERKKEHAQSELETAETDSEVADLEITKWRDLLLENKKSEEAEEAVRLAEKKVGSAKLKRDDREKAFFEIFQRGFYRFFIERALRDAQKELADTDKISKGVPSVNDRTIKFLLERHECICGTKFEDGDDIARHLYELLAYVPPKDLGTYIAEFDHDCQTRTEEPLTLHSDIKAAYNEYKAAVASVRTAELKLARAHSNLEGINHVSVKNLRKNLNQAQTDKKDADDRAAVARNDVKIAKSAIKRLEREIEEAAFKEEKNRSVRHRLAYVDYMHNYLRTYYSIHEAQTRNELAATVNKFFTTMYDGELHIAIDENYGVTVVVDDIDTSSETWKTSSGQTLAIILAFILGILEIAKNNIRRGEELLQGDTYPLVMDAPLSDFDKTRIGTICNLLPNVAEQVIIIIKDTDGDLAEQYLSRSIGARYTIVRRSDYDSKIRKD